MTRRRSRATAAVGLSLLLAGCTAHPADVQVTALPSGVGPAPTIRQVGSSADIAAVHDAATRALSAALSVFDVDEDGDPLMTDAERRRLIDATTTGPQHAKLEDALTELGRRPFRRGGAFVVEHWDGVQIAGDRARAYVSGHSAYTPTAADPQKRDGTWQYRLLLVHRDGRWLVSEQRAASDGQG